MYIYILTYIYWHIYIYTCITHIYIIIYLDYVYVLHTYIYKYLDYVYVLHTRIYNIDIYIYILSFIASNLTAEKEEKEFSLHPGEMARAWDPLGPAGTRRTGHEF